MNEAVFFLTDQAVSVSAVVFQKQRTRGETVIALGNYRFRQGPSWKR